MKITLLGFGNSTAPVVSAVGQLDFVSEIVLVNERPGLSCDLLQDLQQSIAIAGSDTKLNATRDLSALEGSQIVLLLSQSSRPIPSASLGTRLRSVQAQRRANITLAQHLARDIKRHAPEARVVTVIPPVCALASSISRELEAETGQVIGLSGGFANAYLKTEIASQLNISARDVAALVIGNDEALYPLPQYCRVNGIPLDRLMSAEKLQRLISDVTDKHKKFAGVEMPHSLATWVAQVVAAIGLDKKRMMSVASLIQSGSTRVYLNVPTKIGRNGAEAILRLDLTEEQKQQFTELVAKSVSAYKQ
jgi:malate dehydrogenase